MLAERQHEQRGESWLGWRLPSVVVGVGFSPRHPKLRETCARGSGEDLAPLRVVEHNSGLM